MRTSLIISIGINLLLVTGIGLARVDSSRSWLSQVSGGLPTVADPVSPSGASGPSAFSGLPDMPTVGDYYDSLRLAGLAHHDTLLPVSGWVTRALAVSGSTEHRYWAPDFADADAALARRYALENAIRADLRRIYGPEAESFAEFRPLYFPLGEAFGFLSSVEQVALAQRRGRQPSLVQADRRSASPDAFTPGAAMCRLRVAGHASERGVGGAHFDAAMIEPTLPPEFDASAQFEYALRVSPLASRLRPLDLDELSFRSAFRALQAAVGSADARERLQAVRNLRQQLGMVRSDELLQSFDPDAAVLRRVLAESAVNPSQAGAALTIIARSREALLELLASGFEPGAPGTVTRIAEIHASEREQLQTLLGAELAERISVARRRSAVQLSAGPGC